ncbi:MAG TPA: hypothetical protein VGC79_31330 [Polyangiaceae bacterium]
MTEPAPHSELPKDSPGVLAACEAGNATACFWAACRLRSTRPS